MNKFICITFFLPLFFIVNSASAKGKISIEVKPGPSYTHKYLMFNLTPQMAFWIEDTNGQFISTIYVTKFSSSTFGKSDVKRPAALPVWRHKGTGQKAGVKGKEIDALTGATPQNSFSRTMEFADTLKPGKYNVFAEINCSFDYNDVYSKNLPKDDPKFNDANGQPSVVYKGTIITGNSPSSTMLKITGHGSVTGKDGTIYSDMAGITTAEEIVKSIDAVYNP